eukprot:scaffold121861_cov72-Phaeocystis_antarctica.AAC.1
MTTVASMLLETETLPKQAERPVLKPTTPCESGRSTVWTTSSGVIPPMRCMIATRIMPDG